MVGTSGNRLAATVDGAGWVGLLSGAAAWMAVRRELSGEQITIPPGAALCAGRPVRGPLSAFAEAEFIKRTTLKSTGGLPYGALAEGDPAASMAKEASLLRGSLFTSILAFGVALAGMAVGAVLIVVGRALGGRG